MWEYVSCSYKEADWVMSPVGRGQWFLPRATPGQLYDDRTGIRPTNDRPSEMLASCPLRGFLCLAFLMDIICRYDIYHHLPSYAFTSVVIYAFIELDRNLDS